MKLKNDYKFSGKEIDKIIENETAKSGSLLCVDLANDLKKAHAEIKKIQELLKFADTELSITQPYPDPESGYDVCRICGHPDFDHDPNCAGLKWKKEVQAYFTSRKG